MRRYTPTISAIGMVANTVAVDHGLCAIALTTISDEHRDQDDHDEQRADQRRGAAEAAEFVARHLAEAAPVAPGGAEHDEHVLHATRHDRADQQPQRARQIAELRGERRPDQRTGARDRGEVVAEHDRAMGRHEVAPVLEALGRRRARRVEPEHAGRDPAAVEAVADQIDADRRDHEPHRIDGFAAIQGDAAECGGAGNGDRSPGSDFDQLLRCHQREWLPELDSNQRPTD